MTGILWVETKNKRTRIESAAMTTLPAGLPARMIGTAAIANRPAVCLLVTRDEMAKEVAIDRKTGVILRMITRQGKDEVSRMVVEEIAYGPVTLKNGDARAVSTIKSATPQKDISVPARQTEVRPRWLPAGMAPRSADRTWCDCCRIEMVVVRYSDGLRSLSLFEMGGAHHCAMNEGCAMAPAAGALVESRQVGTITVVAVGDLSARQFARMMDSLR